MVNKLNIHHLRLQVKALDAIVLTGQKGVALRGALYAALRRHHCPTGDHDTAAQSMLCPVCRLLATESPDAVRGHTIPRPLTIEPPLSGDTVYHSGDGLNFGISLIGDTVGLFPYLALAVPLMGSEGVGKRVNEGRRGRFSLEGIEAVNPLSGASQTLMNSTREITALPSLPVSWEQAVETAKTLPGDRITLRFLTPTRIVDQRRLVHRPLFQPLFQRLLERLISLAEAFGDGKPDIDAGDLVDAAGEVRLVKERTHWVDLHSGSRRLRRSTPIGGFVGKAVYEGPVGPLLPWVLMGQSVHVGKSATKGNGWYDVIRSAEPD